jgi:hypothetical protein
MLYIHYSELPDADLGWSGPGSEIDIDDLEFLARLRGGARLANATLPRETHEVSWYSWYRDRPERQVEVPKPLPSVPVSSSSIDENTRTARLWDDTSPDYLPQTVDRRQHLDPYIEHHFALALEEQRLRK